MVNRKTQFPFNFIPNRESKGKSMFFNGLSNSGKKAGGLKKGIFAIAFCTGSIITKSDNMTISIPIMIHLISCDLILLRRNLSESDCGLFSFLYKRIIIGAKRKIPIQRKKGKANASDQPI